MASRVLTRSVLGSLRSVCGLRAGSGLRPDH